MNDKKNIERLFQEKFKDFEVNPSPELWGNIASQLEKKKEKRRIFPFWFNAKAAGIAAALVLGFFTLNTNSDWLNRTSLTDSAVESQTNSTIVEKSNVTPNEILKKSPNSTSSSSSENQESGVISSNENGIEKRNKTSQNVIVSSAVENKLPSNQNPVASNVIKPTTTKFKNTTSYTKSNNLSTEGTLVQNNSKSPREQGEKTSLVFLDNPENAKKIAKDVDEPSFDKPTFIVDKNKSTPIQSNTALANSTQNLNLSNTENPIAKDFDADKKTVTSDNKQLIVKPNDKNPKWVSLNSVVSDETEKDSNGSLLQVNEKNKDKLVVNPVKSDKGLNGKLSEEKGISITSDYRPNLESQFKVIQNDSIMAALAANNPLERILREKEIEKTTSEQQEKVEPTTSKWGIRPTVAVLFSGASQGSPISEEFADNEKSFESKFGLGIGVDYAMNKKLTIRTGISRVDMAYNTNDISFHSNLSGRETQERTMKNINKNPASSNVVIEDKPNTNSIEASSIAEETGVLKQELGYIEIPMEISYKLIDKKLGLNFVTGISTLFLSGNKISITSNGMTTEIGEANNLNKVHFSTNIGVGMKYNISKSFDVSVEPMLKYQIKTFSNDSGNFKPYVMGVYSGFRYKF